MIDSLEPSNNTIFQSPFSSPWRVISVAVNVGGLGYITHILVTLTGPSTAGVYGLQWQAAQNGTPFGDLSDFTYMQVV